MKARIDPDEFDLSQLRETCESPGYALISRHLAETHAKELGKMATIQTWDNARFLQGVLAGLQIAAESPKILAQNITARSDKKRKAANAV